MKQVTSDHTHFYCDSCERIISVDYKNIVKVAYSTSDGDSQSGYTYTVHHCAICDKCKEESNG